jgi:Tol biopolymer transport system component
MGEVYRATDTRLDRQVAIKVLPRDLSDNPIRRQRLEREARAISRLSHPHICALHDIGEADGVQFLVMEYLDGETLAHRLRSGALPIRDVLRYAMEIAGALDHAHRSGIIHRDLKPANIMLTRAGAMLLDFGLAKALPAPIDHAGSASRPSHVRAEATITEEGAIVGTIQYMAPEQLEEKEIDARADIFAFGAVLYEMATGRVAFDGTTKASVIAAILERPVPPVSAARLEGGTGALHREPIPRFLDPVVARCLAKHPDERWQTASDLQQALSWIAEEGAQGGAAVPAPVSVWKARLPWLAAAGVVVLTVGLALMASAIAPSGGAPDAREVRFDISPPHDTILGASPASVAISPDGRYVAFHLQSNEEKPALWIRSLDALAAVPLRGTEGATQPFWSPDSRFLGYLAGGKLKRIEIARGVSQTLADASQQSGAWSRDGVILFKQKQTESLFRISADGGAVTPATTLDASRAETSHAWPQFLPDGRRFLYVARSTQPEHDGVIYLGSLDSSARTRLLAADSHAAYAPPGYLLFIRGATLLAQPFDIGGLRVTGEAVPVAGQVVYNPSTRRGAFSVSQTGVLVYRAVGEKQSLIWVNREGQRIESIGQPGHFRNPALSPDEQRVAVARTDPETGSQNIWLIDLARGGNALALTVNRTVDDTPVWSLDGRDLVFRSNRTTSWRLYRKAANGTGPEEILPAAVGTGGEPLDWSRDGRVLLYQTSHPKTRRDVWTVPLDGDRTPVPVLQTEFNESQARLSPNGRWMAYVSDESSRPEVYVRAFPVDERKWRISEQGGTDPRWRDDGKELFYLAPDRNLMAVAIATDAGLEPGVPRALFEVRLSEQQSGYPASNHYSVGAAGQRFLVIERVEGTSPSPITVVLNWNAALNK